MWFNKWLEEVDRPDFPGFKIVRLCFGDDFTIETSQFEVRFFTTFSLRGPNIDRRNVTPERAAALASELNSLLLARRMVDVSPFDGIPGSEWRLRLALDGDLRVNARPHPDREAWRITWPDMIAERDSFPGFGQIRCPPGGQAFGHGVIVSTDDMYPAAVRARIERYLETLGRALDGTTVLPSVYSRVASLYVTLHWPEALYWYMGVVPEPPEEEVDRFMGLLESARMKTESSRRPVSFMGRSTRDAPKMPVFVAWLEMLVKKQLAATRT